MDARYPQASFPRNQANLVSSWRWIFILEGIVSVLFGLGTLCLLPDSPVLSGKWLTGEEQRFLNLMHFATRKENRQEASEKGGKRMNFKWKNAKQVVSDGNLYLLAIVIASNTVPNNGLKFTMPQIIRNMGFTSTNAQLLTAPPYISGAAAALLSSIWADKYSRRMPPIVLFQVVVIFAMSVLFAYSPEIQQNVALCYSMVVLACIGVYPIVPGTNAWTANNLAGPAKRSIGIAFVVTVGNMGGFAGSWIFLDSEKPKYPTGFGTSLSIAAAGVAAALLLEYIYSKHNKRWAGMSREAIMNQSGYTERELTEMGDKSPLFKYGL